MFNRNLFCLKIILILSFLLSGCTQQTIKDVNGEQNISIPATIDNYTKEIENYKEQNYEEQNMKFIEVNISGFKFVPATVEINAGETVRWVNKDSTPHDVISEELFKSPIMRKGDLFEFTFYSPGVYEYYCGLHPSMKGVIIVN